MYFIRAHTENGSPLILINAKNPIEPTEHIFLILLSVDEFIERHVKNLSEHAEHFNIRLRPPLLPICIATFHDAQSLRNLFLRQFATSSYHLQILTKQFIHTKILRRTTHFILTIDKMCSTMVKNARRNCYEMRKMRKR